MAALTDIYGSQETAIEKTCEIFRVKGKIIPVTFDNVHLVARYENGRQVLGEHYIDEPEADVRESKIVELEVFPKPRVNKRALQAIGSADLIVLGPGDLYTSVLCNLVIEEIAEAVRKSKAKKVYILNLMTKFAETKSFSARDHLREIEKYLGGGIINVCLVNKSKVFPKGILARYRQERAFPVKDDLDGTPDINVIRGDFVSSRIFYGEKGDKLARSLIRHDPQKLAKAIVSLL